MTSGLVSRAVLVAALGAGLVNMPAQAQVRREAGVEALGMLAHPGFAGGGLWGAVRTSERLRLGSLLAFGEHRDQVLRGEVVAQFLLDPDRTDGAGLYAGGGIAAESGALGQAWVVAMIGIEGAPGGRSGWMAEIGVGGGVRLAAGWRWRMH